MNVAFCAYDGMTALDFVGGYDPITRLHRMDFLPLEWDVCARTETVTTDGLTLDVDQVKPDLGSYDLVFVPGGMATRALRHDESFVEWIGTASESEYVTSVCTRSILLGAAGLLEGRSATTHPSAFGLLEKYAEVVDDRVVHDGPVITGRGVSSSLDLGLYIVEELSDRDTRRAIAEQMDYPYDPPFQA
ncbi:Putative intracellular protease/amidase [Halanaeroarchaeum sp. HSR-CO]|uniref:DJ-1/PfpI family protein n=1 Tax=Halanaeroarchaeum sp. HSR-CO TaxID=2866382 RepID=UPI00217ECEAC|nr:DJ-1/PfpI family protein [Halanaeroarchaeum sp. HSR-CO]UWG48214.1 Putative intracellular protease/amidase [Halanaeroarchaeum sp. HSR-CO]